MKKLLTLLTCLLLLTSVQGQILRYSNYQLATPPAETPDFYDEYDTVYAAFTTKPSEAIAGYQEALVYSLDTMDFAGGASVWDRLDLFLVFAAHTNGGSEALINWFDPGIFNADDPTTTQWDNLEGYTGDGTTDYISTNFAPSTDATNYTLNSASVGIYLRTNISSTTANAFGIADGTARTSLHPRNASDYYLSRINNTSGSNQNAPMGGNSQGLWVITRTASNVTEAYHNGTSIDSDVTDSNALPTAEFFILDCNGISDTFSAHQVSIFFIMNGITDAEATAINTVIETYMDAIGKGVE
jgi:hypothetical protein